MTFSDAPWLRLHIEPPMPLPDDARLWAQSVLEDACPDGAEVRVIGSVCGRSPVGWPLELIYSIAVRDGAPVESRLVGLYEMLGHVAAVSAFATDRERFVGSFQTVLLPMLASARPLWRSATPVALAELWSLHAQSTQ